MNSVNCFSFGIVGIDNSIPRNTCDPELFEKAKIRTMMHWAADAGKEVGMIINKYFRMEKLMLKSFSGVVTSTRLTHATPAALYAHSADRN